MAKQFKKSAKVQTRQIAKGITLTGTWSVDQYDDNLRKEVEAKREAAYTKEVHFEPDFSVTEKA